MAEERSPWARPEAPQASPGTPDHAPRADTPRADTPRADTSGADKPRAASGATESARPRKRRGVPLAIAGIVALALAAGGGVAYTSLGPKQARQQATGRQDAGAAAVRYLEAIARADASAALELASQQARGPLLTDETLRLSQRLAPITDITVAAVHGSTVELAYRLGGQPVNGKFPMVQLGDGKWLLQRASVTVTIAPRPQMIPTKVNGIKLDSAGYVHSVEAFPGTYAMTTGSPWLDFASRQFTIHGLDAPVVADAKTAVSTEFPDALKSAVERRLQACLKTQELAAKGCPWAFREDIKDPIDPTTIKYSLRGDPWQGTHPPQPGSVHALADGELAPFTVRFTGRGRSGSRYDTEHTVKTKYQVDLLSPDLEFVWQ